jgi:HPt (histidine-containing phosphotransfer) domain-containing protein
MSDEFLKVARQEIQSELDELEQIVLHCNNDEDIFKNSHSIKMHLHKIKGLAPMMGQEKIGELAKTSDSILRYIMSEGPLPGSCPVIAKTVEDMKKIFGGLSIYDLSDFKKQVRDKFPQISEL